MVRSCLMYIQRMHSIKKKKQLLQNAIKAYETAIAYRVADVTTSATYQIAELYHDFAKALLKSERPKGLSGEVLEEYNLLLEDQAFPFEEKAINIHAANLNQVRDGVYTKWTKRSLDVLQKLQPGRYAKHEKINKYVEAIH